MATKINWHRYGTKLRHCRPMYTIDLFVRGSDATLCQITLTTFCILLLLFLLLLLLRLSVFSAEIIVEIGVCDYNYSGTGN